MKPLTLLLFTIITRGGFGEAAPTHTSLEKRIGNEGDHFPVLTTKVLAPQATAIQFYRDNNWQNDAKVQQDKSAKVVLENMKDTGLFTAVILRGAQSSVVGPNEGLTTPEKYLKDNGNGLGTSLITNGGFFITGTDKDLVSDFKNGKKGVPLPLEKYKGYSVGSNSVAKNFVQIPSVHADLYETFTAEDHTTLTSGPDLRKPVDKNIPPVAEANTDAGRLQYFVRDPKTGEKQPSPKKDEPFLRSEFTHVPGGVVTANEPNERNVLVVVDADTKIVCTYTSQRNVGMKINEMRDLIGVFLKGYLKGKKIEDTKMALNLDGGGSIFVGWMKGGVLEVLATGNLANPTQEPANLHFRDVTTMVKHSVRESRSRTKRVPEAR